jgi:hypothetical protein
MDSGSRGSSEDLEITTRHDCYCKHFVIIEYVITSGLNAA